MWTRREFLKLLVLSAAGTAAGSAVVAAREHGGGRGGDRGDPEGPPTPMAAPTRPPHLPDPVEYKRAILDIETGHMTCKGKGTSCEVVNRMPFVTTSRPTGYHGPELRAYTRLLNKMISELRSQNRDRSRELAILITPYVPFLAWCQLSESAVRRPVSAEDNPQRVYEALGISRSVAQAEDEMRRLGSRGSQVLAVPTRNWAVKQPGSSVVCYPSPRARQSVAGFAESERSTPAHDETLRSATRRINELLSRAAAGPRPEGTELAILLTPVGLFLAWSRNEGPEFKPSPEAVTGDSPADVVIRALQLELPE